MGQVSQHCWTSRHASIEVHIIPKMVRIMEYRNLIAELDGT